MRFLMLYQKQNRHSMSEKDTYTTKEVAEILGVTDRTVQRYLNSYYSFESGSYRVSGKMLAILKEEYLEDTSDTVVEEFTGDEYIEFKKRLIEYPILKEQLEYHRKSSESHNRQIEKIIELMLQRNFIEARDKKLD